MRDPKRRAKSMAILWLRKCYDLGITAGEVVSESAVTTPVVTTVTAKEKENGKENFPPAPPIEKREKEEKAPPPPPARACVRKNCPRFEQVESYAAKLGATPAFAKSWYDQMCRDNWLHGKTGKPIQNWMSYMRIWWKRQAEFDPMPISQDEVDAVTPKLSEEERKALWSINHVR